MLEAVECTYRFSYIICKTNLGIVEKNCIKILRRNTKGRHGLDLLTTVTIVKKKKKK